MARIPRSSGALQAVATGMRRTPTRCEHLLWQRLKRDQLGVRFRRQHPVGGFVADFYAAEVKLVIEADGRVHERTKQRDAARDARFRCLGALVLRFRNDAIESELDVVVSAIQQAVDERLPLLEGLASRRGAARHA